MEKQTQYLNSFVQYISQLVSLNRRLQKKKISIQNVKLAFVQLDSKRKGYLDLANIYQLAGQNTTEEQLFHLFKWLDRGQSGDITLEDFEIALASNQDNDVQDKNNDNKKQKSPFQSVKQLILAFLDNLEYQKNLKNKLNINQQCLSYLYRSICQSQRKTTLKVQDLVYVMSFAKGWDSFCQTQLKNLFKQFKLITQKNFIEKFVDKVQETVSNTENIHLNIKSKNYKDLCLPVQLDQSQLLDEINKQYNESRNYHQIMPATFRSSPKNQQKIQNNNQNNRKTLNYQYPSQFQKQNILQSKSYVNQFKQLSPSPKKPSNRFETSPNNCQNLNQQRVSEPQSMLNNIERRREQLKKGSLQRKKIIQQALSRKKINNFLEDNTIPTNYPQSPSYNIHSNSKLNNNHSTPQITFNYNSNNLNVEKIFSKYRDQRNNERQQKIGNYIVNYPNYPSEVNQKQIMSFRKIQEQKYNTYGNGNMTYKSYIQNNPNPNPQPQSFTRSYQNNQQKYNPNFRIDFNKTSKTQNQFYNRQTPMTPKFTSTFEENLYSYEKRPQSLTRKVDKIHQIREKINNLPQKRFQSLNNNAQDQRDINIIIEKYRRNTKAENISSTSGYLQQKIGSTAASDFYTRPQMNSESKKYPNQVQSNLMSSYLKNKQDSFNSQIFPKYSGQTIDFRAHPQKYQFPTRKNDIPQSYMFQNHKIRNNGSIMAGNRPCSSTNNIQKQNLLKRAQQQAARKIQQIQRRAKMKVLERKTAVGLKWIK